MKIYTCPPRSRSPVISAASHCVESAEANKNTRDNAITYSYNIHIFPPESQRYFGCRSWANQEPDVLGNKTEKLTISRRKVEELA